MPIATPDGQLVTLGSVAEVTVESGPVQINHRERQRTIKVQVTPAEEMPLQTAMETIEAEILDPMRERGALGGLYQVSLSGTSSCGRSRLARDSPSPGVFEKILQVFPPGVRERWGSSKGEEREGEGTTRTRGSKGPVR